MAWTTGITIDVRHLQMVAAIAASGSVTHAAAAVHLTQSAVSHQLRGLEDRLGTPLFLRLGKRMVPTAAGQRILTTAHRVLEEIAAVEGEVRGLGPSTGILRVCAQCNTGYHWLPSLIALFQRDYPDVDVAIALECTARPVQALLDGHLDIAIVTEPVRHPRLRIRALFEDEHAAIVPPDHRLAAKPFVRPQDLADERLVLYSSSPDDSFTLQKILRPAGVTPKRVSFVMLTEAILEMVRAGLGISVMQTWAIEPALRAGVVTAVPITRAGIHRQWSAVTLRDAARRPFVDAFIDLLAARAMPARRRAVPRRPRAAPMHK
jgi:LysR family transcriptional regulator, regulator for metE and metH